MRRVAISLPCLRGHVSTSSRHLHGTPTDPHAAWLRPHPPSPTMLGLRDHRRCANILPREAAAGRSPAGSRDRSASVQGADTLAGITASRSAGAANRDEEARVHIVDPGFWTANGATCKERATGLEPATSSL